jgi:hypothetical protein
MTEIKTSKDTMKLTKNFIYFSHINSTFPYQNNILHIDKDTMCRPYFTTLLASSNPLENFAYFSHINSSDHFTYW